MITNTIQITVYVADLDEAREFYTDRLGFVVRADEEFGPDWHYLTVAPTEESETVIELAEADTPGKKELVGGQAADGPLLLFASDDIETDYRTLADRGVEFDGEPKSVPGGRGVPFEDPDGNQFDLYQRE